MAEDSSVPGILRYLKGRTPEQPTPMNYDVVSFARSVMVSDVQKLFVSASFPPELRLQVMKAGVPYNTTSNLSLSRSMKSIEGLKNEAHRLLLFPPRERWYQVDVWADEETSNIIRSTAEQAFLETAIFKLCINDKLLILEDEDWMSRLSSIPETIGTRIHYLDLDTTVYGHSGPYNNGTPLFVSWCRRVIAYMNMLKLQFPNLKACILTLDLCLCSRYGQPHEPFDQEALQWTMGSDSSSNSFDTSLPAEASSLFNAFVAEGPGKSQFVRIRDCMSTPHHMYQNRLIHCGPLVKVDGKKMAAEPGKGSPGAQLFRDAYRLARSGQQTTVKARMLEK